MPMTVQIRTDSPSARRPAWPGIRTAALLAAGLTLLAPVAIPLSGRVGRVLGIAGVEAAKPIAPLPPPDPRPVRIGSADRLQRLFERLGYDLDAVAGGTALVPPVELAALPADLDELKPVDRRKAVFIRAVLPIVIGANAAVAAERVGLEALLARLEAGGAAGSEERHRFRRAAGRYGLPDLAADAERVCRLLRRVDGVPVSLAVAQAISESGWGTSRFARSGNALFGQWTWDERAGIVPAARRGGDTHRVRAFETLGDSARAYLFNLNTHPAYAGFRKARAAARRHAGALPAGARLARHLTRYRERGGAYVEDLVTLIRQNRLARLDAATLGAATRYANADAGTARPVDG